MAPLYDAVSTRVFPHLRQDRMALNLNGKDDNLRRKDFRTLATTVGLKSAGADEVIDDLVRRIAPEIDRIALPASLEPTLGQEEAVKEMLELCRGRVQSFT